jgi:23S rRNA (guanine2445-N2)-methyltransferase / 23S rRNA (guanine2069-N7)-methyltransferase
VEALLASELSALGAQDVRETVAGVYFGGPWSVAYRACLWSRLANRVLWPVADVPAADGDQLYAALVAVDWGELFDADCTIAVDFSGESRAIRNTQFGAQRTKDAVVDWFSRACGRRPSVERRNPDVRINVRYAKGRARVGIDLSGGSLHQRGYRLGTGDAPLKENLAAALLLRADWPGVAARGGALIDPMCGSATLLLEGAMMAADIAPGLERSRFGFERLRAHDARQWQALLSDARGRAERGRRVQLPEIRGYDADPRVIRRAQENIARLDMQNIVRVSVKPLAELKKPTHKPLPFGLVICNPPYGERLGERRALAPLYRQLGEVLLSEFSGWRAAVFTADKELGKATGLRSHKRYSLYNGALATSLFLFDLADNRLRDAPGAAAHGGPEEAVDTVDAGELSEGARMFANRLRKNRKRLASWVKREHIDCYRLYDADMPEYAVAVDIYAGRVHVAEYKAPAGVAEDAAARRLREVRSAIPEVLGVAPEAIVFKQRRRQRGKDQYEKRGRSGRFFTVREGNAQLLVNLHDYLDTGLFLDHRPLRLRIAAEARDRDFLNLFCYTGAATVHAALGGANSTTSVDLSNTYLDWLRRNLEQNGLGGAAHKVQRANCLEWLRDCRDRFDLIMLDPPSFSNSSSMEQSFDVQRDHEALVRDAMALLREGGSLYFSNNRRGFKLSPRIREAFDCEDISAATIDVDFQRNPRIHCCWLVRHRERE